MYLPVRLGLTSEVAEEPREHIGMLGQDGLQIRTCTLHWSPGSPSFTLVGGEAPAVSNEHPSEVIRQKIPRHCSAPACAAPSGAAASSPPTTHNAFFRGLGKLQYQPSFMPPFFLMTAI
ncbi:MAG: hypothetical protein JWP60_3346 [Ramlibacter sp.]|nr:hypothetical protein [Ramlibacter sp.]